MRASAGPSHWRVSVVVLVSLGCILIAALGLFDFLFREEPNYCINTFMNPHYQPLPITSRLSHKYSLILYRETVIHSYPYHAVPAGVVPVLFIPGNGGSGMQVRSIASEAARIAQRLQQRGSFVNELAFFAADFKEELSAFDGDLLWGQAEFVNDCIREILAHIKRGEGRASSVILIGHSMGGLVARATFLLPNYVPLSVDTIVTLNSPHRTAPVFAHHKVASFYREVNSYWLHQFSPRAGHELANVSLVSIAGSFRDRLIRSELTDVSWLLPPENGFALITTSIPTVRLQIDHACIVWCNPMVKTIANTLYNLLDKKTGQATLSLTERMAAFKKGFIRLLGLQGIGNPSAVGSSAVLQIKDKSNIHTSEDLHDTPSFTTRNADAVHISFNISHWTAAGLDRFILYTNLELGSQVKLTLTGKGAVDATKSFEHIAIPPPGRNVYASSTLGQQRLLNSDSKEGFSFLLNLLPSQLQGFQLLHLTKEKSWKPYFLFCEFFKSHHQPLSPSYLPWEPTGIEIRAGHPLLLNISFPPFSSPPFYPLSFVAIPKTGQQEQFPPVLYAVSNNTMVEELLAPNVSSPQPIKFHQHAHSPLYLLLVTDPEVSYTVKISFDITAAIGIFFKAYGVMIISFGWALGFSLHAHQLYLYETQGLYPSSYSSVINHMTGWASLLILIVPFLLEIVGGRTLLAEPLRDLLDLLPTELLRDHSLNDLGTDVPPLWLFTMLWYFAVLGFLVVSLFVSFLRTVCTAIVRVLMRIFSRSRQETQISQTPRPSLLHLFLVIFVLGGAHATHPLIGIALAWLLLLLASSISISNFSGSDTKKEAMHHYQHFLLTSTLSYAAALVPSFIIWFKGGAILGSWQAHSLLGSALIVHMHYASRGFFNPSSKEASMLRYFCYQAALVTLGYCLIKWYRALDLVLLQSVLFIYHIHT